MSDANNIMGFIPKGDYVKYTYYLLLASTAGSVVLSLLAVLQNYVPLGPLFNLAGILGLVMALLGFFVFKSEFSALDQAHLAYLSIVIAVFFVAGLILGASFVMVPVMMYLVMLLVGLAQLLAVYTGYNSWKGGRTITKHNIQSEIKLALKRG